jgi:predicted NBD/HSP70 family sugar kinase
VAGLEGARFARELNERLGRTVTIENDINLAALGEQWRGVARGVDDFVFISIGTGLGAGLVLRGELHRGRNGAAGELDYTRSGLTENIDPCAGALIDLTRDLARGRHTSLDDPYDTRLVFAAARAGDEVALEVVAEEARRIALHIAPIAAVADVGLVVLGGGIGSNGDLLFDPIRRLLANWLPSPPSVEASSLGEAAVLTGALAVGLRAALDNVFLNRRGAR